MLVGVAGLVSWSCSLDWTIPDTPDAATGDVIVSPTVDATARDAPDRVDGASDAIGETTSVDVVVPTVGCKTSQECQNGVCAFDDFRCGGGEPGACTATTKCVNDSIDMYLCLCDKTWVFGRPCDVFAQGVDFFNECPLPTPNGAMPYGYVACESSSSVVVERPKAPHEERYRCAKANCQVNDCTCLMQAALCDKPVKCTSGSPTVVICD